MKAKEIKAKSRILIKNIVTKADLILLFTAVSLIFFSALPFLLDKLDEITGLRVLLYSVNRYIYPVCLTVFMLLITLAFLMTLSSVNLGEKAWFAARNRKYKNGANRLCFWFKPSSSVKATRLYAAVFTLKSIWTVIFLLPAALMFAAVVALAMSGGIEVYLFIALIGGGILLTVTGLIFRFIVIQRYFLAPHLMASDPKLGVIQAIKRSKNLLDGHIFEVVKFKLSFLPWIFPSLLIVPIIYIYPFYKQSCSVLANEICL